MRLFAPNPSTPRVTVMMQGVGRAEVRYYRRDNESRRVESQPRWEDNTGLPLP